MEAIEKLRNIINWYDFQSEYINEQFKSIKGLEMAYDYAQKNDLEFIDDDYIYSEVEEGERPKHIQNINKFKKIK